MKRDAAEGMNGDSAMVGGHGGSRRHGENITGKLYAWPDLGGREVRRRGSSPRGSGGRGDDAATETGRRSSAASACGEHRRRTRSRGPASESKTRSCLRPPREGKVQDAHDEGEGGSPERG